MNNVVARLTFFFITGRRKVHPAWLMLLCSLLWLGVPTVAAQAGLEVHRDSARVVFPDKVKFTLEFHAPAAVDKVVLLYGTNAHTCQNASARQTADFKEEANWTMAEWEWDLETSGPPPGALLHWQWQVTTKTGEIFASEPQEITIEDARYTWHKAAYGDVTVYWVKGDAAFGQKLQEIGVSSLARLSREVGIEPPAGVRLMVYPDANAVQAAGVNLPEWTGGFAVPEYSTVMLGIPAGELDWAGTIIPHELAHLVSDQRTFNCKGASMPTWLSEGISIVAEGMQMPSEREMVIEKLKVGRLPALRSLANGFAANSQRANLSYAQSGVLVRYFIATYGSDGMDRLLQGIQDGLTVDRALQAVTGLDTDELDEAWRVSLGYGQQAVGATQPAITHTAHPNNTAIATLALWTQAVVVKSPTVGATVVEETVQPPSADATPTPPGPASHSSDLIPLPVWFPILAGALLLGGGAAFAIRRTFRR